MPLKVLLVAPTPLEHPSLAQQFKAHGHQVCSCQTAPEGLEVLGSWIPDVLVLDLQETTPAALDLVSRISQFENILVMVVLSESEVQSRAVFLNAGADALLFRPFEPRELDARFQALVRRTRAGAGNHQVAGTHLDVRKRLVFTEDGVQDLTGLEVQLLALLMQKPGAVQGKADLERQLYGWDIPGSNSLEVRVSQLRKKLILVKSHLHIQSVRNVGYALVQQGAGAPGRQTPRPAAAGQVNLR